MKNLHLSLYVACLFASLSAVAEEGPAFDCTVSETKIYIEQVTRSSFAPSNISNPEEFMKAFVEKKQNEADAGSDDAQSCVTIFNGGQLKEDWKELVKTIRELDVDISFSPDGAALKILLDKIKERVKREVTDAMSQLGQDVCAMLSQDNLEQLLLTSINDKYGLSARNLRIHDFSTSITDQVMANAPDNVQMLLSEDQFYRAVSNETRGELKKVRKELWDNF